MQVPNTIFSIVSFNHNILVIESEFIQVEFTQITSRYVFVQNISMKFDDFEG